MYMCVRLPPENLNLGFYPLHPTSIYTNVVTTAPMVRSGMSVFVKVV